MQTYWLLVGYDENNEPYQFFGPFMNKQAADDYADEFGGAWSRWQTVELTPPNY